MVGEDSKTTENLACNSFLAGIYLRHNWHRGNGENCRFNHSDEFSWTNRNTCNIADVVPCYMGNNCYCQKKRRYDTKIPQVQHYCVDNMVNTDDHRNDTGFKRLTDNLIIK